MKREDEEFCKEQFKRFLNQFYSSVEMVWEGVEQQDEPPDYYLFLRKKQFAVEVTTLVEKISLGDDLSLPPFAVSKLFKGFAENIQRIALRRGYLQGHYVVYFPTIISNFSNVRDDIQDKLLDYIQNTYNRETAPLNTVFEIAKSGQRPQQCGIQKLTSKSNKITTFVDVDQYKWEGQSLEDICNLLTERLNTKTGKLIEVEGPKILLLLDEYKFADRNMYQTCVPYLASLTYYHTVFVSESSDEGFVLYSLNHDWQKS